MLELHNVHAGYGAVRALHGVSLSVARGEFVSILGRNGAGKSTIVKCISGILNPDSGSIIFEGQRIDGQRAGSVVRRGVTVAPEGRQLFADLSVVDNLRLGAYSIAVRGLVDVARAACGMQKRRTEDQVHHVVSLLPELAELLPRRARDLSGGQQQMVSLARALMARPKLLVVDELSLGLAPLVTMRLLDHLVALREKGVSVLLVEQNVDLALSVADRAYIVDNGVVRRQGPSAELREASVTAGIYFGTGSGDGQ